MQANCLIELDKHNHRTPGMQLVLDGVIKASM